MMGKESPAGRGKSDPEGFKFHLEEIAGRMWSSSKSCPPIRGRLSGGKSPEMRDNTARERLRSDAAMRRKVLLEKKRSETQ